MERARAHFASELMFMLIIIKSIFVDFVFGLFGWLFLSLSLSLLRKTQSAQNEISKNYSENRL